MISKDASVATVVELQLLSLSFIASSSVASAVRSGKEVKTGSGTSEQCGIDRRADSIKIVPILLLSLIPSGHIHHAKITVLKHDL